MSIYHKYTDAQMDNHLSNFLIDSWSYSKLSQFARNEKCFEMYYIYGEKPKQSSSTVAGQAYHYALDRFFNAFKDGQRFDLVDLEGFAFGYIEDVPLFRWKVQKTTPSVEECIIKANKTVSRLLNNFYGEISTYIDDIAEIIHVEFYIDDFLTINGVDIPLPVHLRMDLSLKTKSGLIVIADHKSKAAFSDDQAIKLAMGMQAIVYVKGYEANTGINVDEVWFIENKYSKNKDGSEQLHKYEVKMDKDTRRLYEALLYEPLKRMIQAVNDPDYIYLINESDNFVDKAEMFDFWAKTLIAEIDDFPVNPKKKDQIEKRLKKIRDVSLGNINPQIIKKFKESASDFITYDYSNKNMTQEEKITQVLRTFGKIVEVKHQFEGYSSNSFLLAVSAGVKVSSIQSNKLDIANALDVSNVRISKEMKVYEGKSYVEVEFSKQRDKDLIFNPDDLVDLKIPIGKDNYNNTIVWDLNNHSTPHALVCGATGCLAGDTDISIYVPHYARPHKKKTIKTLFEIKNGIHSRQTQIRNRGKKDILVRCLDEKTNEFTYTPFDVVYSGAKQCYKVTTSSGNSIETTEDHRFLTPKGWKRLSELSAGSVIMYKKSSREFTGKKSQLDIKDVFLKYHPKGRIKNVTDGKSKKVYKYFRVPMHHFIYEAHRNNLSTGEYKKLLNNYDGRDLFFIPKDYQIDHIDGDRTNNNPSNLQMLSASDHARKTLETAEGVFGYFRPNECEITSIEATEIKDTYDICCNSDNHNFVANGLVVHNSGKSVAIKSTIEYALSANIPVVILDPKFEFNEYKDKASVYNEILDIEEAMIQLVDIMQARVKNGSSDKILVVFDEFADAVDQSRKGNDLKVYEEVPIGNYANGMVKTKRECTSEIRPLETNLKMLLQKGRSVGFRVIAGTQRASTKVITGDAKANFPVQICFRVPKAVDSQVVLDEVGAEALSGRGDGLIKSPEYNDTVRFQAYYKP